MLQKLWTTLEGFQVGTFFVIRDRPETVQERDDCFISHFLLVSSRFHFPFAWQEASSRRLEGASEL